MNSTHHHQPHGWFNRALSSIAIYCSSCTCSCIFAQHCRAHHPKYQVPLAKVLTPNTLCMHAWHTMMYSWREPILYETIYDLNCTHTTRCNDWLPGKCIDRDIASDYRPHTPTRQHRLGTSQSRAGQWTSDTNYRYALILDGIHVQHM